MTVKSLISSKKKKKKEVNKSCHENMFEPLKVL